MYHDRAKMASHEVTMAPDIHEQLSVLGVPVRTRMLGLLEQAELGVGEVARITQVPQSTASRHLKVLHDEGWVIRRKVGTSALFRIRPELDGARAELWAVVRKAIDERWPDDVWRLKAVLADRDASTTEFFGRLGREWSRVRDLLYGTDFLLDVWPAMLPPDAVVADLGCGPGDLLERLAPWVRGVVGVDREPEMLRVAGERLADQDNVTLVSADLEALDLPAGSLDLAICMLVLHHIEHPERVLHSAAPALRSQGRLVVVDMVRHDREEYRRTMGHRHLGFSREDLEGLAEGSGLTLRQHRVLPPAPEAEGPALFVATFDAVRRDHDR